MGNIVCRIMRKVFLYIIVIALIAGYGCKPDAKKFIEGEWFGMYGNDGAFNNFVYVEFDGDSIKLWDENHIFYKSGYIIKNDSILIGRTSSLFKVLNDTSVELLNHVFVRGESVNNWKEYKNFQAHINTKLCLPEYNLTEDTPKVLSNTSQRVENISVCRNDAGNIILINHNKIDFQGLNIFLESNRPTPQTVARLFIDKTANMGFVDSVFSVLDSVLIFKLLFVFGNNSGKNLRTETQISIVRSYGPFVSHRSSYVVAPVPEYIKTKDVIDICNNHLLFNNNESDSTTVIDSLRNLILAKPERCVFIVYNNSTTYDFFIRYLAAVRNLYSELRNHESFIRYHKSYNSLGEVFKTEIVRTLPQRIIFLDSLTYQRYWNVPYEGF